MIILRKTGFWLLVAAIVVYAIFPFYYAILSSMKTGSPGARVTMAGPRTAVASPVRRATWPMPGWAVRPGCAASSRPPLAMARE